MTRYVVRHGKRIAIETLKTNVVHIKQRRKPFRVEWVKLPQRWIEALQQSKSVSTYRLAHIILFEAFKREHLGGEIILSAEVTGMPSATRVRATKELIKLELIRVRRNGRQAVRVIEILYLLYRTRE